MYGPEERGDLHEVGSGAGHEYHFHRQPYYSSKEFVGFIGFVGLVDKG